MGPYIDVTDWPIRITFITSASGSEIRICLQIPGIRFRPPSSVEKRGIMPTGFNSASSVAWFYRTCYPEMNPNLLYGKPIKGWWLERNWNHPDTISIWWKWRSRQSHRLGWQLTQAVLFKSKPGFSVYLNWIFHLAYGIASGTMAIPQRLWVAIASGRFRRTWLEWRSASLLPRVYNQLLPINGCDGHSFGLARQSLGFSTFYPRCKIDTTCQVLSARRRIYLNQNLKTEEAIWLGDIQFLSSYVKRQSTWTFPKMSWLGNGREHTLSCFWGDWHEEMNTDLWASLDGDFDNLRCPDMQ